MSTLAAEPTGSDTQRQALDAFVEAARASHFKKVCAFNTVYVAARLSGYDITFHDVLGAMPPPAADDGISIKAICDGLDRLGVKHFVRYETGRYHGNPRGAGIAYTAPEVRGGIGHVWALRSQGGMAQVIDPPNPVKMVPLSQPLMPHSMIVFVLPKDATILDGISPLDWMSLLLAGIILWTIGTYVVARRRAASKPAAHDAAAAS
jgi:hypothetical protein